MIENSQWFFFFFWVGSLAKIYRVETGDSKFTSQSEHENSVWNLSWSLGSYCFECGARIKLLKTLNITLINNNS